MPDLSTPDAITWAVRAVTRANTAQDYARYRRYVAGDHDLAFASEKFRSAFGALFKTFAYNRCSRVVQAYVDRLAVERFAIGDDASLEERATEIWRANNMASRQKHIFREVATCGDAYALVWPDPVTLEPVIWPEEAHHCRVKYDPERLGHVTLGTKVWREDEGESMSRVRVNLYEPDHIARFVSVRSVSKGSIPDKPDAYEPFRDDDAGPEVPNPWGIVPLFHFTLNAWPGRLGTSILRDVIPLNDALNKTLADMMIAEEFGAWTQKVIMGVDVDPQDYGGEAPLNPEGAANDANLQKFRTGADRILAISNPDAKIGEFSPEQLVNFDKVAETWDARISRESGVPVHYLTLSGDFPSGRALRTAEAPWVALLESAQDVLGEPAEDMMRLALLQAGVGSSAALDQIEVIWRSAAPLAEEDKWDLVLQMTTTGVPLQVALKRIGWTEDEIAELVAVAEAEEAARMEREIAMMTAGQMAGDEEPVA